MKTTHGLNTLFVYTEKVHHRHPTGFQIADPTRDAVNLGVGGLQVHGTGSHRLMYKEVIKI